MGDEAAAMQDVTEAARVLDDLSFEPSSRTLRRNK